MRPPTRWAASSTNGVKPRSFSRSPAAKPAMPPPTITTSGDCGAEIGLGTALSPNQIDRRGRPSIGHVREVLGHRLEPFLSTRDVVVARPEGEGGAAVG